MTITQTKLHALCNGCGKLMRDMGEWPVRYPREISSSTVGSGNILQARLFACAEGCKTPSKDYDKGYPVMISLVDID